MAVTFLGPAKLIEVPISGRHKTMSSQQPQSVAVWIPFLMTAMISLIFGLLASLWRLGVSFGEYNPTISQLHGPLMVSAFLGTLIGIERAVSWKSVFAALAPIAAGLGIIAVALFPQSRYPLALFILSAISLTILFVQVGIQFKARHLLVMGLGAAQWLVGNVLWFAGIPFHYIVPWWMGFLVFTIVGERLELNRLLPQSFRATLMFWSGVVLMIGGTAVLPLSLSLGIRIIAVGWILAGVWLLQHDITRHTIKTTGLSRFIAVSLIAGYVWMIIGGAIALWKGLPSAGFYYDAILHTIFVGFVFSMIFGHAPIIFPAILKLKIVYQPYFYGHLLLLHAGLLVRVWGDLVHSLYWKQVGGVINVIAVLLFLGATASSVILGAIQRKRQSAVKSHVPS